MKIGGQSIEITNPGILPCALLDIVVRTILDHWQSGIVQNADNEYVYKSYVEIPFNQVTDLFIYKTMDDFKYWTRIGVGGPNTMAQLILCKNTVTMVVDKYSDEIETITDRILSNLL
jgi:hypothetical protein